MKVKRPFNHVCSVLLVLRRRWKVRRPAPSRPRRSASGSLSNSPSFSTESNLVHDCERDRDRSKIAVPRGTSILNRFSNRAPASDILV